MIEKLTSLAVRPFTEDEVVAILLEAARTLPAGEEHHDGVSLGAFKSLAASRDLPLEVVLRSALRGNLADIVRLPVWQHVDGDPPAT